MVTSAPASLADAAANLASFLLNDSVRVLPANAKTFAVIWFLPISTLLVAGMLAPGRISLAVTVAALVAVNTSGRAAGTQMSHG